MMSNSLRTPLTEYLDQQQVAYRLLPHHSEAQTIEDAAHQRGISPAQMVKCILLRDMSDRFALACTPGDRSVDPKKVRALLNWRRMTCVDLSQVEAITGYRIGTVTPLLLRTAMPIIFDHAICAHHMVTISSGSLMAGIGLAPNDLIQLCQPQFAHIQRD